MNIKEEKLAIKKATVIYAVVSNVPILINHEKASWLLFASGSKWVIESSGVFVTLKHPEISTSV